MLWTCHNAQLGLEAIAVVAVRLVVRVDVVKIEIGWKFFQKEPHHNLASLLSGVNVAQQVKVDMCYLIICEA